MKKTYTSPIIADVGIENFNPIASSAFVTIENYDYTEPEIV